MAKAALDNTNAVTALPAVISVRHANSTPLFGEHEALSAAGISMIHCAGPRSTTIRFPRFFFGLLLCSLVDFFSETQNQSNKSKEIVLES